MSESITRRITAALERLQALYPEMRFGQLVAMVTELARDRREYGIYDVEDADFLAAAEEHLRRRLAATSEPAERRAI